MTCPDTLPEPTDQPATDDPAADAAIALATAAVALGTTVLGVFAAKELARRKDEEKERER